MAGDNPRVLLDDRHSYRWLASGDAAFATMLALIEGARRSVAVEFYIYTDGVIARRFRHALVDACRRGVRVRVLLDAFGARDVASGFWNEFEESGGELRWFNPLRYLRWSFRDHRKLVVVDGVAVVGGINIADEQIGDGVQVGWRDLALEARGPIVADIQQSFNRMWALASFEARAIRIFLQTCPGGAATPKANQLLLPGPGCQSASLALRLHADLVGAREVSVHAPYFLPSRKLRGLLRRVAAEGRVRILITANSDVPLAQLAVHRTMRRMHGSGVQFYEYRPQVLHSKLVIVDDVVYIGSANLDVRSQLINFELMLRVASPDVVAEARAIFEGDLRLSATSVPPPYSLWQRVREETAYWLLSRFDPYIAARTLRLD